MKNSAFIKWNRFAFTLVRVAIFAAFILLVLRPSMKSFFKSDDLQLAATFEAGNPEKEIESHWIQLMSDYEKVRALDLFDPPKNSSNAYEHLKNTVGDKNGRLNFSIPVELKEKIKSSSYELSKDESEKLFSFLKGIEKFDYLKIPDVQGDIGDPVFWDVNSIDGYLDISQILLLRLAYGAKIKNVDQAMKEVHHFLKLIVNLDNKLYPLIVANTLKKETEFVSRNKLHSKIKTYTLPEIESLRNFFLKEGQLSDIRLSDKAFQQGLELKLGLCQRLTEASKAVVIGHEVLKEKYASQILRLKTALESTKENCEDNKFKTYILENQMPDISNEQLLNMSQNIQVDTAEGQQQIDLKSLNKDPKLKEKLIYELLLVYSA